MVQSASPMQIPPSEQAPSSPPNTRSESQSLLDTDDESSLHGDQIRREQNETDVAEVLVEDRESHSGSQRQPSQTYARLRTNDKEIETQEYRKKSLSAWTLLADAAVTILPALVIAFFIVVWRLKGSEADAETFDSWQSALTILGTLFPILFASVAGRLMSESARWKLERGADIASLEQLMGSRTVGSTVHTLLQFPTILGFGLLFLWAFSPLGAQAILRMLSLQPSPIYTPTNITYFDNMSPTELSSLVIQSIGDGTKVQGSFSYFESLYTTLITTPKTIKVDTMDLWGNVKIPMLQNHAADDWEAVPDVAETVQYSSLAGIPTNYKTRGNASFSLESSYIDLSCYNFTRVEGPSFIAFQVMDYEELRDAAETGGNPSQTFVSAPKNGSWHGYKWNRDDANYTDSNGQICTRGQSSTLAMALDRFVDPIWFNTTSQRRMAKGKAEDDDSVTTWGSPALLKNESGIDAGVTRLLLQLSFPGLIGVNRPSDRMEVTCNVTQRYVESRVVCHESADQRSCRVVEQRPSQKQHASEQVSHLSFPRTFNYISKDVPLITSNALSVYYLQDPNFANISQSGKPVATLKSIEDESIGVRLSQLLNTYLALGQLSFRIASGSLEKDTVFEPNITVLEDTVTAVEKYEVSIIWMGLCLLSSVVMLVAGACSVWFTHLAYGPEILGYVSTAIRNSKLVDVPPHTVWLDGPELTKEIAGKRVKYGFVCSAEPSPVVVGIGPQERTQSMESFLDREKGA